MKKHLLGLVILTILIDGCSYRGRQDFSVVTVDDKNATKTICHIRNAQGEWTASPDKTIKISRDVDPVYIRCENSKQWGASQAKLSLVENDLWTPYWSEGVPSLWQSYVRNWFRVPPSQYGWPGSLTTIVSNFPFPCIAFCDVFDFVNDSQYNYPKYVYVGMNNR